jgi:hypothetical protein
MPFPQPLFQVRGTQLKPWYSRGVSDYITVKESPPTSVDASVQALAGASIFGGSVLNYATTRTALMYAGRKNWCDTGAFAVLARIVPTFTGLPSVQHYLFQIGDDNVNYHCGLTVQVTTAGKLSISMLDANGFVIFAGVGTAIYAFTANVGTDIMVEWDGTITANSIKCYQEGVLMESLSPSRAAGAGWTPSLIPNITLGAQAKVASPWYLNELCVFNQTIGAYAARTGFVTSLNVWGDDWTNPGAAALALGTTMHAGLAGVITGQLDEPAPADVRSGVAYYEGQRVGTYDGSDRMSRAVLVSQGGAQVPAGLVITQGDTASFKLTAQDGTTGLPYDLTGATLQSWIQGVSTPFDNSHHVVNPDQVANRGNYILNLSTAETILVNKSASLEIVTQVTKGAQVITFHGKGILQVLSATPGQNK